MNEIENFYKLREYLHRGGAWWYTWTSEPEPTDQKEIKQSRWAPVGKDTAKMEWAKNIYFGVHPSRVLKDSAHRTTILDIPVINCLFAEFDIKQFTSRDETLRTIRAIPIKPSAVVSSGGGYHCYFCLKQPFGISDDLTLARAKSAQSGWVNFTRGDNGAKDLARVLRAPGTTNHKEIYAPHYPLVKMVFTDWTRLYALEQFEELLPKPQPIRPAPRFNTQFGTNYVETALRNETDKLMRARDGNRNDTLNRAAFSLGRLSGTGVSRSRIEGTLLGAALAVGLDEHEAERTIRSGMESALKKEQQF